MRRVATTFFALALAAAPPEFRREYGRAMRADFLHSFTEARTVHGAFGAATYAAGAVADLFNTALREYAAMLFRDLSYALRALRKTPSFTAVVVATLALAIGANAAVFSILDAVVLAPLPYADPSRLVEIRTNAHGTPLPASLPDYEDVRSRTSGAFSESGAFTNGFTTLTGHGTPQKLAAIAVTPGFFETLGTAPELGRFFAEHDAKRGAAAVAVLSDRLWRANFGADPQVLGTIVQLGGKPYRVAGVAPPGFRQPRMQTGFQDAALWTVLPRNGAGTEYAQRGFHGFGIVARLKPGVTVAAAATAVSGAMTALQARYPDSNALTTGTVVPLDESLVGSTRPVLFAFFAAAGAVLVVACANVANLLLSRAASRDREFAVRIAIGASRGRIVTQLLVETFALALAGGVLGVALAAGLVRGFVALHPAGIPRADAVTIDAHALLYTFGVVAFCTLAAGLAPALAAAQRDVATALGAAGRGGDAHRGARARSALVACEIATTLALVVAAGLVTRSYVALTTQPLGFEPAGITLVGPIDLPDKRYPTPQSLVAFSERALARVRAIPGVADASYGYAVPFTKTLLGTTFTVVGRPMRRGYEPQTRLGLANAGYFSTLHATFVAGRAFTPADRLGAAPVAIVNETFARRFFPGRSAIGERIVPEAAVDTSAPPPRTIVGVVRDLRSSFTKETAPTTYLPIVQLPFGSSYVVMRASDTRAARAAAASIAAADPLLPLPQVTAMQSLLAEDVDAQRLTVAALGTLAFVALALSLAGVFAVVSYGVTQRTHEFGVRMALGADARAIVRTVLSGAMRLAAIGIVLGLILAGAGTRLLASQLFQTEPLDPLTFGSVTALVVVAALIAAFVPARRATRVDPIVALRYE